MARYYIPAGRAIGNPNRSGPRLIKAGDPIPPLTARQIDRFVADGSLALLDESPPVAVVEKPTPPRPPAAEPEPLDPTEPEPGYEIPMRFPSSKALPEFLAGFDDEAHIRALWAADGRSSADRHYKKRLKAL